MLYIIPSALSDDNIHCLPQETIDIIKSLDTFYIEDLRTARRFLRKVDRTFDIDGSTFLLINEHSSQDLEKAADYFKAGKDIGLLSDCGCPAVADPGKGLVEIAHKNNVPIKPLVGPNSILLALMASGFNGQSFSFEGYLPNKQPALNQRISEVENKSRNENKTYLFIETPYRNNQLKEKLIEKLHPNTRLCIAANLTAADELIISKPINEWKKITADFHKKPAVFVIYAGK
jgi:16S rRNA (cytidine1402-2'-O)-methyltransferase